MSFIAATTGMMKEAVVAQEGDKWVLWTRDKKRKLGVHATPEAAYKQEYAIQQSQKSREVDQLRTAKGHSDKGRYDQKNRILAALLKASPQDFYVDSPKGKHPGMTHSPSQFRFHAPRHLSVLASGMPEKSASAVDGQDLAHGRQPQILGDVLLHAVRDKSAKHDVASHVADGGIDSVDADVVRVAPFQTSKSAAVGSMLAFMDHGLPGVEAETALRRPQRDEVLYGEMALPSAFAAAGLHVSQQRSKSAAQRLGALGASLSFGLPATASAASKKRAMIGSEIGFEVRKRASISAAAALPTAGLLFGSDTHISGDNSLVKLSGELGESGELLKSGSSDHGLVRFGVELAGDAHEVLTCDESDSSGSVVDPVTKVANDMLLLPHTARCVNGEGLGGVVRELEKIGIYIGHKPHPNPSASQIQANNYRLGHANIQGLDISIENAKGGIRRGVDPNGKSWESKMSAPYGYVRSVAGGESGKRVFPKAVDGDAVDVFIGPDPTSELVIAIDQYKGDKFDESKFILGCHSRKEATDLYLAHYPAGWKLGPTSTTTMSQFKVWLRTKGVLKPFGGQILKAAAIPQSDILAHAPKKPFHDWDGTVIPRIPGNAKAYLESIGLLTPEDVLPDGRGHTEPIDLATARPPMFHKHIRSTAERIGVPVGDIHHAEGDKTELLKKHDRPIIDDDMKIRESIRKILGDRYAIEPQQQKAAGADWDWAIGGEAVGGLTVASLLHGYSKLMTAGAGAPMDRADRAVMRKLKANIRSTPEFGARHSVVERMANRRGDPDAVRKHWLAAGLGREPGGAHYDSTTGKINLSKGQAGPGLLAHELGHKAGPKALIPARGIGMALSNLATFGALSSPDQDGSRGSAIAGTVAGAGTLASEIDASARGYKMLRGAGSGKLRALKSFLGVPTYALMAGLPALAYEVKRRSGGFAPEPVKQASRATNALRALGLAQAPLLGEQVAQQARKGVSIFNVGDKNEGGLLAKLLRHKSVDSLASGVKTPRMKLKDGVAVDFAGSLAPDRGFKMPKKVQQIAPRTAAQEKLMTRVGGDKLLEADTFKGLLPQTDQLSALAAKLGVDPKDSVALHKMLKKHYGGKFIVKPRGGAATSGASLPSDRNGPGRLKEVLGNGLSNRYGFKFKTDAKNMVAQPRLELEPLSRLDQAANNITEMAQQKRWGGWSAATGGSKLPFESKGSMSAGSGNEYRVHVIDGKVVPYATLHRGSVTGMLPWHSRTASKAEQAVQAQLDALGNKNLKGTFGFDAARSTDGKWNVIETNPTEFGGSGLMRLPHIQDAVAGALQGRLPTYVKAQRGIQGLGAIGAGTAIASLPGDANTSDPVS